MVKISFIGKKISLSKDKEIIKYKKQITIIGTVIRNNNVDRQSVVYLQILSSQWVCGGKNVSNVIFGKV